MRHLPTILIICLLTSPLYATPSNALDEQFQSGKTPLSSERKDTDDTTYFEREELQCGVRDLVAAAKDDNLRLESEVERVLYEDDAITRSQLTSVIMGHYLDLMRNIQEVERNLNEKLVRPSALEDLEDPVSVDRAEVSQVKDDLFVIFEEKYRSLLQDTAKFSAAYEDLPRGEFSRASRAILGEVAAISDELDSILVKFEAWLEGGGTQTRELVIDGFLVSGGGTQGGDVQRLYDECSEFESTYVERFMTNQFVESFNFECGEPAVVSSGPWGHPAHWSNPILTVTVSTPGAVQEMELGQFDYDTGGAPFGSGTGLARAYKKWTDACLENIAEERARLGQRFVIAECGKPIFSEYNSRGQYEWRFSSRPKIWHLSN